MAFLQHHFVVRFVRRIIKRFPLLAIKSPAFQFNFILFTNIYIYIIYTRAPFNSIYVRSEVTLLSADHSQRRSCSVLLLLLELIIFACQLTEVDYGVWDFYYSINVRIMPLGMYRKNTHTCRAYEQLREQLNSSRYLFVKEVSCHYGHSPVYHQQIASQHLLL